MVVEEDEVVVVSRPLALVGQQAVQVHRSVPEVLAHGRIDAGGQLVDLGRQLGDLGMRAVARAVVEVGGRLVE